VSVVLGTREWWRVIFFFCGEDLGSAKRVRRCEGMAWVLMGIYRSLQRDQILFLNNFIVWDSGAGKCYCRVPQRWCRGCFFVVTSPPPPLLCDVCGLLWVWGTNLGFSVCPQGCQEQPRKRLFIAGAKQFFQETKLFVLSLFVICEIME